MENVASEIFLHFLEVEVFRCSNCTCDHFAFKLNFATVTTLGSLDTNSCFQIWI